MDGRFEVTLTDSTMMWIVHCAMNKAQEKMKTKKGVIERLHEISKFYELAVMQLEGCLSFVQAETERSSVLDSNHEEVLADLREIKDRLQGRLEESEKAISKKDRELMEKLENKLRVKEGEIGEAPHSGGIDIKKVEEMGSDIDILKQTMDVAFGKIQSALFFGEMGPKLDQQWKITTEKEIMSILVKSCMREFQENVEAQVLKTQGKKLIKCWWEHWSQLMNEATSLRHELGNFITQNEMMRTYNYNSHDHALQKQSDDHEDSTLSSQENIWNKIFDQESDQDKTKLEKLPKEEESIDDEDGSNFVAKMVKKHQSIIRQKSQEVVNVMSEWLSDQNDDIGKEIDEVIKCESPFESSWEKMKEIFNFENEEQNDIRSVLNKEKGMNQEEVHYESLNMDIEKQIEEGVCIERNGIENQIRDELSNLIFKETVEEHNKVLEDYSASMEYRIDQIPDYFLDHLHLVKIESLLKEDLCMVALKGMMREWKVELDDYYITNQISEQMQQFVMVETMKDAIFSSMQEDHALSNIMLNHHHHQVNKVQSEEKLIKILLESLLTCFEAEENLMLSARSEIKEHSRQLDLGSERGKLHEHEILEDLLIGKEHTLWSLTSKVENALQQLGISKELLRELGTTLNLRQSNFQKNHNQTTTKEEQEGKLKALYNDLLSLFNFLQAFTEFEGMLNQKLEILTQRLENIKCRLDPIVELVDFLRNKESIFRIAFNRRCQNLQKAELEVDLLGDQVDTLLALLEKIYVTLYHYAPVLQQYFEVSNMLELIKKQLTFDEDV
ncbi:WPP domain-associated protein [Senna tora]|uniref:WPP domain-associated protein n=1 Tax=Senna tora TaxID=362788 RepID=A0A834WAF9_9FABA|nr:WPP domain-associated protein [Senna tora]